MNNWILKTKEGTNSELVSLRDNMQNKINDLELMIQKSDDQIDSLAAKMKGSVEFATTLNSKFDTLSRLNEEVEERVGKLKEKKANVKDFDKQKEMWGTEASVLHNHLHEVEGKIERNKKYMNYYVPIQIENFITEAMKQVIPKKGFQKLSNFMGKKMKILNQNLDSSKLTLNLDMLPSMAIDDDILNQDYSNKKHIHSKSSNHI
jgi:chromosome segregation ATPase